MLHAKSGNCHVHLALRAVYLLYARLIYVVYGLARIMCGPKKFLAFLGARSCIVVDHISLPLVYVPSPRVRSECIRGADQAYPQLLDDSPLSDQPSTCHPSYWPTPERPVDR